LPVITGLVWGDVVWEVCWHVCPFHHRILYPSESQSRFRNSGKM